MSKEALELALGKALLEPDFRLALLADPDQALAGFQLTKSENASIRRIDSETLDTLANIIHWFHLEVHS